MTDISVDSPFQIADNKKSPWLRLTYILSTKKPRFYRGFQEATTRFELVIRVLQTHALPLGYVAISDSY